MIEYVYETNDGRSHTIRDASRFNRLCDAGIEPDFIWFDIVRDYPPHTITGYRVDCDSDAFWRAMAEAETA
jgi:hypothetical protein